MFTGYLRLFTQVLIEELERVPGDGRTQIGFLCFDRSLYFFNLADGLFYVLFILLLFETNLCIPIFFGWRAVGSGHQLWAVGHCTISAYLTIVLPTRSCHQGLDVFTHTPKPSWWPCNQKVHSIIVITLKHKIRF